MGASASTMLPVVRFRTHSACRFTTHSAHRTARAEWSIVHAPPPWPPWSCLQMSPPWPPFPLRT